MKKTEIPRIDLRGRFYDIDEIRNIRKKLAKVANQRLRELEKRGYTKNAYKMATRYTQETRGGNRFNEGIMKKASIYRLREDLEELQHFLNAQTSTYTGIKKLDKDRTEFFRSGKSDVLPALEITDPGEFFDFLDSEEYKQVANSLLSSSFLIEFYDKAHKSNDFKIEKLKEALVDYKKGKIEDVNELEKKFKVKIL